MADKPTEMRARSPAAPGGDLPPGAGASPPSRRAGRLVEAATVGAPTHYLTNTGRPIPGVVRLAFDGDAAEGMAEVTAHAAAADGHALTYRDEAGQLATPEVTFRAWVRMVPAGPGL